MKPWNEEALKKKEGMVKWERIIIKSSKKTHVDLSL
jgi:hypothetical protein